MAKVKVEKTTKIRTTDNSKGTKTKVAPPKPVQKAPAKGTKTRKKGS